MKKIEEFANKYPIPGWYIDVAGDYCYGNGKFLISVFVDVDDSTYNITIDRIRGLVDRETIEWEYIPIEDKQADNFILNRIDDFIIKYIR